MWWRRLRHLDEWDACIFTSVLFFVGAVAIVAGARASLGVRLGMGAAIGALALRRVVRPSLLERELGPPKRPMTLLEILLVALGIFGVLVTAVGLVLASSMLLEGGSSAQPPLAVQLGVIGFPVMSAGAAAGLIQLARRLRR